MNVTMELPDELHPETQKLVKDFAEALAGKLRAAEEKYGYDDGWRTADWEKELPIRLLEHAMKGDPRDVAAYCAFAWARSWSTTPATSWRLARFLADALFALCEKDADPASFLWTKGMPDAPANGVVVVRDAAVAARLRLWLIAAHYVTPGRVVHPVQREGEACHVG